MTARAALLCGFYNRRHLVSRTIMGMHRQTAKDVIFYLFDDGSSDGTYEELIRTTSALPDTRFVVVRHKRNVGLTAGLIAAANATDSEYIAIHDAGDYSDPLRIEQQISTLSGAPELSVVGSHYINYFEDAGLAIKRSPQAYGSSIQDLLLDTTFTHGEVMFRRSAYDRSGGYRREFRYAQDNDLWLRMRRTGEFYTIPKVLYVRCVQSEGISYDPTTFAEQSAYLCLGRLIGAGALANDDLERLSKSSIFDVVPKHSGAVQAIIVRGAARALAIGQVRMASAIAEAHITSPTKRRLLKLVSRMAGWRGSAPAYRAAWLIAGYYRRYDLVQQMLSDSGIDAAV